MRKLTIGLAGLALLAAGPALADRNAANTCAAGFGSDAKLIYERALPGAAGGGDLPTVVRDAATALVKAGHVARASARSAAQAAGACLKQL